MTAEESRLADLRDAYGKAAADWRAPDGALTSLEALADVEAYVAALETRLAELEERAVPEGVRFVACEGCDGRGYNVVTATETAYDSHGDPYPVPVPEPEPCEVCHTTGLRTDVLHGNLFGPGQAPGPKFIAAAEAAANGDQT